MSDKPTDNIVSFVRNCARCGQDHTVVFEPLTNSDTYNYWAMCPVLQQPILCVLYTLDDEGNPIDLPTKSKDV